MQDTKILVLVQSAVRSYAPSDRKHLHRNTPKTGRVGGPGGSPQASRNDTLALTRTLVAIARRRLVLLRVAFQRTLERSVECGLRFLVLLLRDLALLVFHLELEDFFFQSFEQH